MAFQIEEEDEKKKKEGNGIMRINIELKQTIYAAKDDWNYGFKQILSNT